MDDQTIQSYVVTVVQVAEHFERLKQRAAEWAKQTDVEQRGYFTPSEDEALRQLWISYHQARKALFGVITQVTGDDDRPTSLDLPTFIVAYAASLVLIDIAWFMRDLFNHREVIRSKLNEPEPVFDIAENLYEAIQSSLVSAHFNWRIYQANHYYVFHRRKLRRAAGEFQLDALIGIIDKLKRRARVPLLKLLWARLRVRTSRIKRRIKQHAINKAIYALEELVGTAVGHVSVQPSHTPELPPLIQQEIKELLQVGDVMIVRKEHALSNYFLPGYWPHAALYIGEGQVLEAMADGVRVRSVQSPFGADAIAVLRPRLEAEQIAQAVERGLTHKDKPYDFEFDFTRSDRLVCTEVVYRSYEGIGQISFELAERIGRLTLSAEDLLAMGLAKQGFEVAAVYTDVASDQLLQNQQAIQALQKTMGKRE